MLTCPSAEITLKRRDRARREEPSIFSCRCLAVAACPTAEAVSLARDGRDWHFAVFVLPNRHNESFPLDRIFLTPRPGWREMECHSAGIAPNLCGSNNGYCRNLHCIRPSTYRSTPPFLRSSCMYNSSSKCGCMFPERSPFVYSLYKKKHYIHTAKYNTPAKRNSRTSQLFSSSCFSEPRPCRVAQPVSNLVTPCLPLHVTTWPSHARISRGPQPRRVS
jgi:hypothetical protein